MIKQMALSRPLSSHFTVRIYQINYTWTKWKEFPSNFIVKPFSFLLYLGYLEIYFIYYKIIKKFVLETIRKEKISLSF